MPIGKGSLQRAAGADKKPVKATTPKKPVKTDPAKLAALDVAKVLPEKETAVKEPAAKKPAAKKPAVKKETAIKAAPQPEAAPAVTVAVIPSVSPKVVSHLYCELPTYLL